MKNLLNTFLTTVIVFSLNYSFGNTRVDEFRKKFRTKKSIKLEEIDSSLSKADNAEIIVYEQHLVKNILILQGIIIDRSYEEIKFNFKSKNNLKYSGPSSNILMLKLL